MKFIEKIFIPIACLVAVLSSCTKVDDDITPLEGKIVADREVIGAGQPVFMAFPISFQLPSPVVNIEKPSFKTDMQCHFGKEEESGIKEGYYYKKFYFDKPQKGSITFNLTYILETPNDDGSFEQIQSVDEEFEVVACDVRTSFWGDSKEITEKNIEAKLTPVQKSENSYFYMAPRVETLSNGGGEFVPKETKVEYTFENDHLKMVVESDSLKRVISPSDVYISYYEYAHSIGAVEEVKSRKWLTSDSAAGIYLLLDECDECFNQIIDASASEQERDTAKKNLDKLIINNEITLNSVFKTSQSEMTLSFLCLSHSRDSLELGGEDSEAKTRAAESEYPVMAISIFYK